MWLICLFSLVPADHFLSNGTVGPQVWAARSEACQIWLWNVRDCAYMWCLHLKLHLIWIIFFIYQLKYIIFMCWAGGQFFSWLFISSSALFSNKSCKPRCTEFFRIKMLKFDYSGVPNFIYLINSLHLFMVYRDWLHRDDVAIQTDDSVRIM
jgi:hypothetical protein